MEDFVYKKAYIVKMCEKWLHTRRLINEQYANNDLDGIEGNQEIAACIRGDLNEALKTYQNLGYKFKNVNEMYKAFK